MRAYCVLHVSLACLSTAPEDRWIFTSAIWEVMIQQLAVDALNWMSARQLAPWTTLLMSLGLAPCWLASLQRLSCTTHLFRHTTQLQGAFLLRCCTLICQRQTAMAGGRRGSKKPHNMKKDTPHSTDGKLFRGGKDLLTGAVDASSFAIGSAGEHTPSCWPLPGSGTSGRAFRVRMRRLCSSLLLIISVAKHGLCSVLRARWFTTHLPACRECGLPQDFPYFRLPSGSAVRV